ncbi:MAG: SCO family protein [Bryobacteraceae bacterium]
MNFDSTVRRLSMLAALILLPPVFGAESYFPNLPAILQDGRQVRFYRDLVAGKTVVLHSFFANCHGVCPMMLGKMRSLQEALGDRLGKDVFLISITVNPADDTPRKLDELSKSLGAKPGWVFVSGEQRNIDWILYRLGQYFPAKEDHSTMLLVGNERSGVWSKVHASEPLEKILNTIERVSQSGSESPR